MNENERGPKIGEIWEIGCCESLMFIGIGADFHLEKFFIFEDKKFNKLFVIKKDEFFSDRVCKKMIDDSQSIE